MGVRQHNLILIGRDIGKQYYDDNEWEKEDNLYDKYDLNYKSEEGDIVIISDGYSGEYFIVGKLVKVDYECEGNGFGMFIPDTNSDEFIDGSNEIRELIKELYDIDVNPTYIVMTHYT